MELMYCTFFFAQFFSAELYSFDEWNVFFGAYFMRKGRERERKKKKKIILDRRGGKKGIMNPKTIILCFLTLDK
jgi:hypothetical protein